MSQRGIWLTPISAMTHKPAKNVLITGATGMIGNALHRHLSAMGYRVYTFDRRSTTAPFHYLKTTQQAVLDPEIPLHAVINLAGPSIADGRWTAARKQLLLRSREQLTQALATAIACLPIKPSLFLSASATGYYGLTGDHLANEDSPPGDDFLAQVARTWEAATAPAELAGINTIPMRFGVVLSKDGGMLKQLLLPFRLGLGGRIGDGSQYLSWISIDDVVAIVARLLETNPASGPLNLVAKHPVTNAEFSARLARQLHRPCLMPLPAIVARAVFGEMADALLLGSSRVESIKLESLGIQLQHPTLDSALEALLPD